MLVYSVVTFSNEKHCSSKIDRYRVVENSVYPFFVDKEAACFFAYYTVNPAPKIYAKGNGNTGDSLWYGYYKVKNPKSIYEFPKPKDVFWSDVCSISAISFYPMHGGKKRDVTVIGSCDKQNALNHTFPFVFVWSGDQFVLDNDVYDYLFGFISLTVADIREYIKSPNEYYKVLDERSTLH